MRALFIRKRADYLEQIRSTLAVTAELPAARWVSPQARRRPPDMD